MMLSVMVHFSFCWLR